MDRRDVSVTTDIQVKQVKNPSWINTGKLRATVLLEERFDLG